MSNLNTYINIAQEVNGARTEPEPAPRADHSEQVKFGLDLAKRQAEKQQLEPPKIPSLGASPLAN